MRRRNLITNIFIIIYMMIIFISTISVNATTNLVPLKKVDGTNLKYRNSTVEVMIPSTYEAPERDFRGVWVTPLVGDIAKFTSETQYKQEMNEVFDIMEYYNLNTIIYHVRIMNDALYNSKYNKWSNYYNTNPSWEALPWIIEEAHKRGFEFHAWMNPYRVSTNYSGTLATLASQYPSTNAASNPNNLLQDGTKIILNPGEPAVREFLYDTVLELVENYDVDAIHFDDYFYISNVDDTITRNKYNPDNLPLADWRRLQVDIFIEELHELIEDFNINNNRRVQLGISPSGIWRNGNGIVEYDDYGNAITNGSNTGGMEHYGNYLYSDSKKWIDNEWIDYILPQSYWGFEHPTAGFANVMDWWVKVVENKNVNLYSGMGLYMATETSNTYSWKTNPKEAYNQALYLSKYPKAQGIAVYSFKHIKDRVSTNIKYTNMKEIVDNLWTSPAIFPEIATDHKVVPNKINNASVTTNANNKTLYWQGDSTAKFYVVYKSLSDITFSPNEVYKIVYNGGQTSIQSFVEENNLNYNYGIKPLSISNTLGSGLIVSSEGTVLNSYIVNFYDYYGNIIKTELVKENESAIAPTLPSINAEFLRWNVDFSNVTTNLDVYPIYDVQKFNVVFYDANNNIIKTQIVERGKNATAPENPTKESNQQYSYEFSGWDKSLTNVTSNLIVKPTFRSITNKYNVSFYNDGILVNSYMVEYGKKAPDPLQPTKQANAEFTYKFSHWDTDYSFITKDLNVNAVFDATLNKYTVKFYNASKSLISYQEIEYGKSAKAPQAPMKLNDSTYSYEFISWDKDTSFITNSINVYPVYKEVPILYSVKFYDSSGSTLLKEDFVEYGKTAVPPIAPIKDGYKFIKWNLDYSTITFDMNIYAQYEKNKYTVKFYDEDGLTLLKEMIVEDGKNATPPTAPTKESTDIYKYVFDGWDKSFNNVSSDLDIKAKYITVLNQITIKFYLDDGVTLINEIVFNSGDTISNSLIPTKPSTKSHKYTFIGWDKDLTSITDDSNVNAVFEEEVRKYQVSFFEENGVSLVELIEVEYGSTVEEIEELKKAGYDFAGWYLNNELYDFTKPIENDIKLIAVFNKNSIGCLSGLSKISIGMFTLIGLGFYLARRKSN